MTTPAPSPACPQEAKSGPSRKAIIGWTVAMLAVLGMAIGGFFLMTRPPVMDGRGALAACYIHGVRLREDTVPVSWGGDRGLPERYVRTMMKSFPCANPVHPGTCAPSQPRWARVNYCPECRKVFAAWLKRTTLNKEERSLLKDCIDRYRDRND